MKTILILLGSAPCLKDDLMSLQSSLVFYAGQSRDVNLQEIFDFMAVGLDTADIVPFDVQHVATYHPYELPAFRERRKKAGLNLNYTSHSHEPYEMPPGHSWVDRIWPYQRPSGSSAMLGIEAGLGLGYEKIVAAGCPLSGRYEEFHRGWIARLDLIKNTVRSISGWTRDLVGAPTKEWMRNHEI